MKLYEVITWGGHGRGDDADTIYLVRASDFRSAISEVQTNAARDSSGKKRMAHVVYEIGTDLSMPAAEEPRILCGPYYQPAYNFGWKAWNRVLVGSDYTNEWQESTTAAQSDVTGER